MPGMPKHSILSGMTSCVSVEHLVERDELQSFTDRAEKKPDTRDAYLSNAVAGLNKDTGYAKIKKKY